MRPPFVIAVVALAFLSMQHPSVGIAHGPCDCLFPQVAEPGTKIRITGGPFAQGEEQPGASAYRVILNPEPELIGTGAFLGGAYHPTEPTLVFELAPRRRPTHHGSFMAPRLSPGVYLVAIFDGSEAGGHFTWDYLHLIRQVRGQGTTMAEWRAAMNRAITVARDQTYQGHHAPHPAVVATPMASRQPDDGSGLPTAIRAAIVLAVAAGAFTSGAFWRGRRAPR